MGGMERGVYVNEVEHRHFLSLLEKMDVSVHETANSMLYVTHIRNGLLKCCYC